MSKIQTAQKYVTTDGKEHGSLQAAQAHQMHLDNGKVVDAFLTSNGIEKAQAGFLRKQIPAFLAFADNYVEPAEAPVAETSEA